MFNIAKITGPQVRVNQQIKTPSVRLIDGEGEQVGIVTIEEALNLAEAQGLDLVEVAPKAKPPVCKVMDYGKYKYQQKKRTAEAKKNQAQIVVKEVKVRPKTDDHDLGIKIRKIQDFLKEGNKVKVTMMFRGREMVHMNRAKGLLDRVITEVGDAGTVEFSPRLEGRNMTLIMAPKAGAGVSSSNTSSSNTSSSTSSST